MTRVTQVRTRDGRVVPFDLRRVADTIHRAAVEEGTDDRFLAEELAAVVALYLQRAHAGRIPGVADVEDAVERVLRDTGHPKAARSFLLHRDRRRAARARLVIEDDAPDAAAGPALPLVGGDSGAPARAWSKARIVAALVEEAGLDEPTAVDVARAVEERVLEGAVPRLPTSLVRALVDAELFARGHVRTRERQRVVGVPKSDIARRLAQGPLDRRATDPSAVAESLGEDLLRQLVIEEDVPPEAAEAHRTGDLHLADLGTPLSLRHVALSTEALLAAHLRGAESPRREGARRFAAALAEAVAVHGAAASRTFTLEDLNVFWAPFVDRLEEDALLVEARELLLSPAVTAFPRRGGLSRLELVLAPEVPARLAAREVPPPAPPGTTLSDYDDAALRGARALVLAAAALRREGAGARLPDLTLVVPRASRRDPATAALLRDALALAAETGEPRFVFDAPGLPARGGRGLRATAGDLPDPLRHDRGDVSLASYAGVNAVAAALRAGAGNADAFLDELARGTALAVETAAARRARWSAGGDAPGGSLWGLRRGMEPLLDPDGALHVVEPVGLARAVAIVAPEDGAERESLREQAVARMRARSIEVARPKDLFVTVAEVGDPEAARRLAETDVERFEAVRRWFELGADVSYLDEPDATGGPTVELSGVVAPRGVGARRRVRWRFPVEGRPGPDALFAGLEAAARDPRVIELALDPWPRRWVRPA
ncbi:MAG: hypothetical protein IT460_07005 [Planctomycetes bacterium]|nr:hypothetical protein [Planctomycetota bacterium]